jgi:hypothetical protein
VVQLIYTKHDVQSHKDFLFHRQASSPHQKIEAAKEEAEETHQMSKKPKVGIE